MAGSGGQHEGSLMRLVQGGCRVLVTSRKQDPTYVGMAETGSEMEIGVGEAG